MIKFLHCNQKIVCILIFWKHISISLISFHFNSYLMVSPRILFRTHKPRVFLCGGNSTFHCVLSRVATVLACLFCRSKGMIVLKPSNQWEGVCLLCHPIHEWKKEHDKSTWQIVQLNKRKFDLLSTFAVNNKIVEYLCVRTRYGRKTLCI